jgi:hypothetical protein
LAPFRKTESIRQKALTDCFAKMKVEGSGSAFRMASFRKSSHVEQRLEEDVEQDVATGTRIIGR